jgi:hypothetical protein
MDRRKCKCAKEIVNAIGRYATAYAELNDLQERESKKEEDQMIPIGDQKTGCIGEFYVYLFLLQELKDGQQIKFGKHSQEGWDLRIEKKSNQTVIKNIQVKTISAYAKGRKLSPIHLSDELVKENLYLYVLHLDDSFYPDGFWVIEKENLPKPKPDELIKLKGYCCPDPQGSAKGSLLFSKSKNRVEDFHRVLKKYWNTK